MSKKVHLSDEEKDALKICVEELERDDQSIREKNIRRWKKAEEYWRLNQFVFWSEVASDYKSINVSDSNEPPPKTFGIYRAYGESLIAAMAQTIPGVLFFPDDANNPDDIDTSKAYSLISELIQRHVKAPLLFIHILTLLYNQGLAATYTYYEEDVENGIINIPKFKNEKVKMQELMCPQCGQPLANVPISEVSSDGPNNNDSSSDNVNPVSNNNYQDELGQGEQDAVKLEQPYTAEYSCENCGYMGQPEVGRAFDETIPRLSGYSDSPKGRIHIKAFGPLNVRLSSYAKEQSDIGLLELQLEMHSSAAKDEFEDIADEITTSNDTDSYERWGRTSQDLLNEELQNQVTVRYCWIRRWGFESFGGGKDGGKRDIIKSLKRKFPHGCCVTFVGDVFAEAYNESMDDHWTISNNPLDSFIHGLAIGHGLLDIQDAFNDVKNLSLQKYGYGISETFADGSVLDEELYRQQQAGPGYINFASNPNPGQPLGNSFFQTKTATLGQDDMELASALNADAQFQSGSVPSIFGGNQQTGSKTASEYNQSRNFALQRLSNHWINVKYLWAETMGKSCRLFAVKMLEDEKYVRRNSNSFETVWIRKAELTGKVGDVEPDISEQFPVSWSQKRDLFMQMITLQNPIIGDILLHPNNAQNTKDAIGFPEFYIPGEEDRTKQLIEIRKLSQITEDQLPPDSIKSTVPIDTDADDDEIHIQVIKLFLVGAEGLYLKETNPAAYLNNVLHKREHEANLQLKTMQASGPSLPNQPPPSNSSTQGQVS